MLDVVGYGGFKCRRRLEDGWIRDKMIYSIFFWIRFAKMNNRFGLGYGKADVFSAHKWMFVDVGVDVNPNRIVRPGRFQCTEIMVAEKV